MTFTTPTDWKSAAWWRNRPVEERLFHLHVPKRIAREMDEGHVLPQPVEVRDFIDDWSPGDSLLLQGRPGTGKSLMASHVARQLLHRHRVSGRWVEADDYIDMIKDSFDNDGLLPEMYSSPHLVKYVKGVFDVVVLDGLGEERLTEFAVHELGSLIRKRFDQDKTTIITTKMSLMELEKRYGKRVSGALQNYQHELLQPRRG